MNTQEKFEYWRDIAQYDLDTAEAMFTASRWLYVVFMCQQAIEKLCKGLYLLFIDDNVPRIHDINSLLAKFEDKLPVAVTHDKRQLFAKLSAFYLNNRYPEYKAKLSASLNKEEAKTVLDDSKEAFTWLLTLKP
jgi:HEPN domain-containing protein